MTRQKERATAQIRVTPKMRQMLKREAVKYKTTIAGVIELMFQKSFRVNKLGKQALQTLEK